MIAPWVVFGVGVLVLGAVMLHVRLDTIAMREDLKQYLDDVAPRGKERSVDDAWERNR